MASKAFHGVAIFLAALGCILLIVAISSASWMVACMKYENILNAVKSMSSVSDSMTEDQKNHLDEGTKMAGTLMNVNLGVDITRMPRSVMFGAVALVIALVVGLIGGIVLIVAVGGDQGSYDGKSKVAQRTRSGLILLIVAGLATIVGMAAYTGGTAQTLHNPLMFMASMGQSVASMFGNQTPYGRGKRDVSLDGLGLDEETKQMMSTMLEGMDPMYGYAFFIGWVAAVVLIIAAVFAAVAKQALIRQPYSGSSSVKL